MRASGDCRPVVIFSVWKQRPLFHLMGEPYFIRFELDDQWHRSETRTACGRLLDVTEWRDVPAPVYSEVRLSRHPDGASWIRRDHAELFGRLCYRCKAAVAA